ncbi:hypothetical protein [Lentibacter algarum]|uniref:hypothetical protein n=1 Tax=Lentibacter algarum TaxID=576131 RepID=UPI00235564BC|nr:hypothetical protein [Lentibacter algarum]
MTSQQLLDTIEAALQGADKKVPDQHALAEEFVKMAARKAMAENEESCGRTNLPKN